MYEINDTLLLLMCISFVLACDSQKTLRGEVAGSEVAGGEVAGGEVAGGEVAGGEVAGGEVAGGEVAGGEVAGGEVAGGEVAGGEVAGGEVAGGEVAGGEVAGGEVSGGEVAGGEVAGGEVAGGEVAGGEVMGGTPSPEAPVEPVNACDDFGSTDCFANQDCAIDARCQNVGTEDLQIPCCIRGERGQLAVGELCDIDDGQLTCASSLCVSTEEADQGYCSGECTTDSDCPETTPRCTSIAFSGSDNMWCLPN